MKTTILGGVLFLVPLAVLSIILGKAFQFSMLVAEPLDTIIPVNSVAGIAFVNFLAIAVIVLICYLSGLAARGGVFSSQVGKLDGFLIDVMPGYAVAKGMLGSVADEDDIASILTPVLVRFDDYRQIAFELERDEHSATLFLPGSPSAWSGTAVMVDLERVQPLNLPAHKTVKLLRVLGRGSLELNEKAALNTA